MDSFSYTVKNQLLPFRQSRYFINLFGWGVRRRHGDVCMSPVGLCRCNLETVDVLELLLCRPCEYRRILDLFYSSQRYARVHIALEHRCYLFQVLDPPSLRSSLRDFLTKVASLLPLRSVLFRKCLSMGDSCDTVMAHTCGFRGRSERVVWLRDGPNPGGEYS